MSSPARVASTEPRTARREPRTPAVLAVEVTRFPRLSSDDAREVGTSRDRSPSGLCVGTRGAHAQGSLVRVRALQPDPTLGRARLARVVWCVPGEAGGHWTGLELITVREHAAAGDRGSG